MSSRKLLALALLGLLFVSCWSPAKASDDYDDDEDDSKGTDEEGDVVVLTSANWEDKVKKSKYALVEFYAPWCGHCQKLKPEWAKAATAVKAYDPSIVIAMLDATAEGDLAKQHDVQGYPTIKWFVDGEVASDYNGPRDADGIAKWVKKRTGPAAIKLEDTDGLAAVEKEADVVALGYFKELKGAEYDAFQKVAQGAEDVTFVETTIADVAKAAGLSAPGFVVVTNFEGEERATAPLKGKLTEASIGDHVKGEKLPPTIAFNDKNSQKIFGAGIEKQLLLVAKGKDLEADAALFKAYRKVALDNKGKLVFVTVDMDGTGKDPVVNFFGVKEDDVPVLVGFEMAANKKYKLKEAPSEKSIKAFAEDFIGGKLTPEYKSAEIPADPLDGGVYVVVGKSFEKVVADPEKDVLLEVYAPWCGHCKQLEPIYKKLAKRFAKVDSVLIAKMDGTENEHPDVDVKGFPTIIFYPAGKGAKPITFDGGDRSLKALTKFIKKHATKPFELPKKKASKDEDDESADSGAKDEL